MKQLKHDQLRAACEATYEEKVRTQNSFYAYHSIRWMVHKSLTCATLYHTREQNFDYDVEGIYHSADEEAEKSITLILGNTQRRPRGIV